MIKEMHIDIICRLWDAVRRKYPEKWRYNSSLSPSCSAPARRSVLVRDFLAKNNVTTLEHPTYSPDLAAANFYLFPRVKTEWKRWRSCDATDIIMNATEELKSTSHSDFQEYLPTPLQSLTELYSCTRGLF
jgi:hypothetical protein